MTKITNFVLRKENIEFYVVYKDKNRHYVKNMITGLVEFYGDDAEKTLHFLEE